MARRKRSGREEETESDIIEGSQAVGTRGNMQEGRIGQSARNRRNGIAAKASKLCSASDL